MIDWDDVERQLARVARTADAAYRAAEVRDANGVIGELADMRARLDAAARTLTGLDQTPPGDRS